MGRGNGVGPSAIPITGAPVPHVLTVEEIKTLVSDYAAAAKKAIAAGFDGVEIQGGNGKSNSRSRFGERLLTPQ